MYRIPSFCDSLVLSLEYIVSSYWLLVFDELLTLARARVSTREGDQNSRAAAMAGWEYLGADRDGGGEDWGFAGMDG